MTTERRRFPAPWSARETPGGYCVQDANGVALAYVYAIEDERRKFILGGKLSPDEARRIARGIARLPELLGTGD